MKRWMGLWAIVCLAACGGSVASPGSGGSGDEKTSSGSGGTGAEAGGAGTSTGGESAGPGGAQAGNGGGGADTGGGGTGGAAPVLELFVDCAAGSDAAAGSAMSPFKTLKHALSIATSGQTVWLAPHAYHSTSGEDWSVPVPAGVTVAGIVSGEEQPQLVGPYDDTAAALVFEGDGSARDLIVEGFWGAVQAESGAQTLERLTLRDNQFAIVAAGTAVLSATALEVSQRGGFFGDDVASLAIDGANIHDLPVACDGPEVVDFNASSTFALKNAVLDTTGPVVLSGAASGSFADLQVVAVGQPCDSKASFRVDDAASLSLVNVDISGGPGAAVDNPQAGSVTLVGGAIDVPASAIAIESHGALTITDTLLASSVAPSSKCGVVVMTTAELQGVTLQGFLRGVCVSTGTAKIRSTLFQTGTGVMLFDGTADLGQPGDAGGNDLGAVKECGLWIANVAAGFTVPAAGNLWIPGAQGAVGGVYPAGKAIAGPYGNDNLWPKNVRIEFLGPKVQF